MKGALSPGQRDSGLALQCDLCGMDPCQCGGGSYADQLSAFMTPAVTGMGPGGQGVGGQPGSMMLEGANSYGGEIDWAAHYGGSGLMSTGGLLTASGQGMGPLGRLDEDCEVREG